MFGTKTLSEIKAELLAASEGKIKGTRKGRALARALDKALTELENKIRKVPKPKPRLRAKER